MCIRRGNLPNSIEYTLSGSKKLLLPCSSYPFPLWCIQVINMTKERIGMRYLYPSKIIFMSIYIGTNTLNALADGFSFCDAKPSHAAGMLHVGTTTNLF